MHYEHPLSAIPHGYVMTPHGLRHASCVHRIERTDPKFHPCKHPPDLRTTRATHPAGWVESATFAPFEPLGSMCVTFTVPDPPSKNGALIFLFPGAEDAWMSTIMQPVLQWGYNGCFGGDCWTIASWHVTPDAPGSTFCSPDHVKVHPGETIVGTVKVTDRDASLDAMDWLIETKVAGHSTRCVTHHARKVKNLLLFLVAGALEAYSLESLLTHIPPEDPSLFPAGGSTTFTIDELSDLNGRPLRADWKTRSPAGDCRFNVEVSQDRK